VSLSGSFRCVEIIQLGWVWLLEWIWGRFYFIIHVLNLVYVVIFSQDV
jgi:hypothetical protein